MKHNFLDVTHLQRMQVVAFVPHILCAEELGKCGEVADLFSKGRCKACNWQGFLTEVKSGLVGGDEAS